MRAFLRVFFFVFNLSKKIFLSALNERSILQLVVNFWINFSPVFVWLLIFKNAGLIPKKIRPHIYVRFAMRLDNYMFNIRDSFVESCLLVICIVFGSWLLYLKVYKNYGNFDNEVNEGNSPSPSVETCSNDSRDLENQFEEPYALTSFELPSSSDVSSQDVYQEKKTCSSIEVLENPQPALISSQTLNINQKILRQIQKGGFQYLECWHLAPLILCASSWFILNIVYEFREPINALKDILAWASYVLGHFFVPLFTAIWLYVFHAPGALKLFSFGLGMQNIGGVLTHLIFPNAPPWFISLNGENAEANYDLPGYAAGLTRVDFHMGTHLHSKGFHASPIVFGAIPSLHSAMAVMVFFFVSHFSRWKALKIAALSFVILQWWATIYLDHHWRLDLFIGMFYSIISFTILKLWSRGLAMVDKEFIKARFRFDFKNGSTMGMRVFKNTKHQRFFDPLS